MSCDFEGCKSKKQRGFSHCHKHGGYLKCNFPGCEARLTVKARQLCGIHRFSSSNSSTNDSSSVRSSTVSSSPADSSSTEFFSVNSSPPNSPGSATVVGDSFNSTFGSPFSPVESLSGVSPTVNFSPAEVLSEGSPTVNFSPAEALSEGSPNVNFSPAEVPSGDLIPGPLHKKSSRQKSAKNAHRNRIDDVVCLPNKPKKSKKVSRDSNAYDSLSKRARSFLEVEAECGDSGEEDVLPKKKRFKKSPKVVVPKGWGDRAHFEIDPLDIVLVGEDYVNGTFYAGQRGSYCGYCPTLTYTAEKTKSSSLRRPVFPICCGNGKNVIEENFPPPPELLSLFLEKSFNDNALWLSNVLSLSQSPLRVSMDKGNLKHSGGKLFCSFPPITDDNCLLFDFEKGEYFNIYFISLISLILIRW